jgi:hypothetical protein
MLHRLGCKLWRGRRRGLEVREGEVGFKGAAGGAV